MGLLYQESSPPQRGFSMRTLISLFLMDDSVVCAGTSMQNKIYMWIRRSRMSMFARKFWRM